MDVNTLIWEYAQPISSKTIRYVGASLLVAKSPKKWIESAKNSTNEGIFTLLPPGKNLDLERSQTLHPEWSKQSRYFARAIFVVTRQNNCNIVAVCQSIVNSIAYCRADSFAFRINNYGRWSWNVRCSFSNFVLLNWMERQQRGILGRRIPSWNSWELVLLQLYLCKLELSQESSEEMTPVYSL